MSTINTFTDIVTAVENAVCIKDSFLKNANLQRKSTGRLISYAGGFSVVFPMKKGNETYAFRCWKNDIGKAQEKYKAIDDYLKQVKLPYFVNFQFVEQGILVNGKIYPTIRMDWSNGLKLKDYIQKHLNDSQKLNELADNFLNMAQVLHQNEIAHGDYQHGNILVNDNGSIVLVDYDSLYVPALENYADVIKGLPDYQHPARAKCVYVNPHVDYFSELIIYLAIKALAEDTSLWHDFNLEETDNLLFEANDFKPPFQTEVYNRLANLSKDIQILTDKLKDFCQETDILNLLPLEKAILPPISPEDKAYQEIVKKADKLFHQEKYGQAAKKYKEASSRKPAEVYPKDKLNEIEIIKEKELDDLIPSKYQILIKEADELFKNEKYGQATKKYEEAENEKPSETYPKKKRKEIEDIKTKEFDEKFLNMPYNPTTKTKRKPLSNKETDVSNL